MGLDVYLHRYTMDRAKVKADEAAVEAAEAEAWRFDGRGYQAITDTEKEQARAVVAAAKAAFGIVGDCHPGREDVKIDSAKHPEHMFKIGYMRSSYNDGGANAFLHRHGVAGLYEIFGFSRGEHNCEDFAPDWEASRARAEAALTALRAKDDGLDIWEVGQPIHAIAGSKADILNAARQRLSGPSSFGAFSDGTGTYFTKPCSVVAVVNGAPGFLGSGVYVVTKSDASFDWYAQALEVVIEMIDYVIAQPDREAFSMYWSA